jgi:hypothetical protein
LGFQREDISANGDKLAERLMMRPFVERLEQTGKPHGSDPDRIQAGQKLAVPPDDKS